MDTNVVHRYSHLGEKLLRTTYNAPGVKLTGKLQVCNGCARSKANSRAVRKQNYTRASQPGERIFVDMTGPLPKSLVGKRYWIGVVDDYNRYSWSFFTKKSLNLKKRWKMFLRRCRHVGLQLSIYVATIQDNTNQTYIGRAKNKRLLWNIRLCTRPR